MAVLTKETISDAINLCSAVMPGGVIPEKMLDMLTNEIKNDFPKLTIGRLSYIIINGLKGEYGYDGRFPLNFTIIYRWVKTWQHYSPKMYEDLKRIQLEQQRHGV